MCDLKVVQTQSSAKGLALAGDLGVFSILSSRVQFSLPTTLWPTSPMLRRVKQLWERLYRLVRGAHPALQKKKKMKSFWY